MLQRWQLVHPAPVIAIVVGVALLADPARREQRAFDGAELAPIDHDVDIGKEPARCRRKPGCQIGGALEQHDRRVERVERAADAVDFPHHLMALALGHAEGAFEVLARPVRHVAHPASIDETLRQAGLQAALAGLPEHALPIARRQAGRRIRLDQQSGQEIAAHGRVASSRLSKMATASSSRLYSKSWQLLVLTTFDSVSKPIWPSSV